MENQRAPALWRTPVLSHKHSAGVRLYGLWHLSTSHSSPRRSGAPGFTFPASGPLDIGSLPSRSKSPPIIGTMFHCDCRKPISGSFVFHYPPPIPRQRRLPALSSSQVSPMKTCPALRPRWCQALTITCSGLLPPSYNTLSALTPRSSKELSDDHDNIHFGAQSHGSRP